MDCKAEEGHKGTTVGDRTSTLNICATFTDKKLSIWRASALAPMGPKEGLSALHTRNCLFKRVSHFLRSVPRPAQRSAGGAVGSPASSSGVAPSPNKGRQPAKCREN